MNDRPGGPDRNCNGVVPPLLPTPAERGLADAAGNPDYAPGTIDLALLITIDCWRGDAFLPEMMPRLSAYAARGMIMGRSYAAATSTKVSTKLMQRPNNRVSPVAQRLSKSGVSSTAVVGLNNMALQSALVGFGESAIPEHLRWSAPEVTQHAIADIDAHAGRPHYLWVHYFDAHTPYDEYDNLVENDAAVTPPSYPRYLAELRSIDTAIGVLLDHLDRRAYLDRSVVIVTGDHGEGFGEHEVMRHHVTAFEAVTRVPAVLLAPGFHPGRPMILVSGRDLPATLLGAFGRVGSEPDAERFGRSWLRLRDAPTEPLHRFVTIRSGRAVSGAKALSPVLAIVEGRYKLVRTIGEDLSELYDVIHEPGEERDRTPLEPSVTKAMERQIELFRDIDHWPDWPPPEMLGE